MPREITISSLYWDAFLQSWGNATEWNFVRSDIAPGTGGYTLEVRATGAEVLTAILSYSGDGQLRRVTRLLTEHGQVRRIEEVFTEKIVLSNGFPVPYDFLSPDDRELRRLTIRNRAGGAVFSTAIERELKEVGLAEAFGRGMINEQIREAVAGRNLRFLEVLKDGERVARQLWAEGLAWWLYEETPYRKSWLTGIAE